MFDGRLVMLPVFALLLTRAIPMVFFQYILVTLLGVLVGESHPVTQFGNGMYSASGFCSVQGLITLAVRGSLVSHIRRSY